MALTKRLVVSAALALGALVSVGERASAQEEEKLGWFFTAELTYVLTAGNSQASTMGGDFTLRHVWERDELKFEGGAIRSQTTFTTRTAVGTEESFQVNEVKNTETTAEAFYLRGRYDRKLSERFFLFGGADWLRNTFSGIDSRMLFALGAGNSWADNDRTRFRTDYSFTYTFQGDVVENPFVKTKFPGARLAYDFWWQLTESTEFTSVLISDWNLRDTDDIRLDFTNALPISISSNLAFKPSVQLLWRNTPSLTTVPLFDTPGGNETGTVAVPLGKLDTFFRMALVVKF